MLSLAALALTLPACSSNDEPGGGGGPDNPAFGAGEITFGYCSSEIGQTFGITTGTDGIVGGAIYIPLTTAQQWKGNKITALNLAYGTSSTPVADIFICEGKLDGGLMPEPVFSQEAKIASQNNWNKITLDQPYEVTGETDFFVGFTSLCSFGDRPLALDYILTDRDSEDNGDWIGICENRDLSDAVVEWTHGGPWFGRVCLQLIVSGDNLPKFDVAIDNLFIPEFVGQNEEFSTDFYVTNKGIEPVYSVTVALSVDGNVVSQAIAEADTPIAPGQTAWMTAYGLRCTEVGTSIPVTLTVTEINGSQAIIASDGSTSGEFSCSELFYEKNPLFEEFTGTWCGWCPRGIYGIEYMQEKYGDQGFIVIAGHYNDEMQSDTYVNVVNTFSQGSYPSAVVDRTYSFDPGADNFEEYFLYLKGFPAMAEISIDATYDAASSSITVESSTVFGLDFDEAPFRLAFVTCQNDVGPYVQTNYFSGGQNGPNGGWESYPGVVVWEYNEVARTIVAPFGIEGSLPDSIEKGKAYSYTQTFSGIPAEDIDDYYVVAMILDASNSRVVNATQFEFD